MRQPQLFDVVRLLIDLPDEGLHKGDIGAIILIFDTPNQAYEVEFVNDDGTEKATCTLFPEQFEVVDRGSWTS